MMGQDAALAGGRGTHFPSLRAAPGPRPEALGPPARSSLMAWPAAWAMAESAPGSRSDAAMARRKEPCTGNGARAATPVAPDGAPSPSVWREEGKTGLSRASTKNRDGRALANPAEALLKGGCLTIEPMKHVSSSDLILTSVALLLRFRRVPERIHLCKRRVLRPLATRGEGALDRGKALLEFEVGVTQYAFGISGEMTRQIDYREQQIADRSEEH